MIWSTKNRSRILVIIEWRSRLFLSTVVLSYRRTYRRRFFFFFAKPTSSLLRALRSALYSMLTSAVPPPVERYVYLEVLATAELDIFFACLQQWIWFLLYLVELKSSRVSSNSSTLSTCKGLPFATDWVKLPRPQLLWVHFYFLPRSSSSSSFSSRFRSRPAPYS